MHTCALTHTHLCLGTMRIHILTACSPTSTWHARPCPPCTHTCALHPPPALLPHPPPAHLQRPPCACLCHHPRKSHCHPAPQAYHRPEGARTCAPACTRTDWPAPAPQAPRHVPATPFCGVLHAALKSLTWSWRTGSSRAGLRMKTRRCAGAKGARQQTPYDEP